MQTYITILGIVLLISPYILIWKSEHKLRTFLTVFTYTTLVHIVVALGTQGLHVFNYYSVLFFQLLVVGYCVYQFKNKPINVHQGVHSNNTHVTQVYLTVKNFLFPIVFLILAVYLLVSIHFNYTGYVDTVFGLQKVSNSSYLYPMYSDEWVGASFIEYSVRTGSLPLANALNSNSLFPNFLFVSHSLFAHTIVLLGLDVVSNYIYFAILNTLLICIAIYFILRHFKVRAPISAITAFSTLLLTNSGNLPGLWSLLPYSASLMFVLYSILSHVIRVEKVSLINLLIAFIVYPPMIVFIIPIWLSYKGLNIVKLKELNYKKILRKLYVPIILVLLFMLVFVSKGFSIVDVYTKILSYIIRNPLDQGRVYYALWNVMPAYMTPFVLFGIFVLFKQNIKTFIYPLCTGIFFWVLYCFVDTVYLIEPARVVVVTSVFMVIGLGFGLEKFYSYVQHKTKDIFFDLTDPVLDIGIKVLVFAFFAFWTIHIGRFGLWHRLPLYVTEKNIAHKSTLDHLVNNQNTVRKLFPAPPVTRYLRDEDLKLFSNFSGKKFISPQWKGLVIGVATHNYPLDSKPSMVTNNILSYDLFNSSDCKQKQKYIDMYKIDLVYSASTTCSGFKEIGKTPENLYLYTVNQGRYKKIQKVLKTR